MNAHKNYRSLVIIAIYFYILCYVVWCILLDMRFPRSLTVSLINKFQEQPSRDVLMKRYSENMQQIYRRTPMPKCDFNKVAAIALRHGCSPENLLHVFKTPFLENSSEGLLLRFTIKTTLSGKVAKIYKVFRGVFRDIPGTYNGQDLWQDPTLVIILAENYSILFHATAFFLFLSL